MAWVKLDDLFPEHPKVIEAGPVAAWLHVRAIAYSNRNLTDGFVSNAVVRSMSGVRSAATLTKVGLWEKATGGYQIHDYLEYQPSRDKVLGMRQQKKDAGRRGGLAKAEHSGKHIASDDLPHTKQSASNSGSSERLPPSPYPVPVPSSERAGTPRGGRRGGLRSIGGTLGQVGDDVRLDLVAMAQAAGNR